MKFKGPSFTLEVTATDYSGNTGTAEPVDFAFLSSHDGHSHDGHSHDDHMKKGRGSDDDSGSGPRKKRVEKRDKKKGK